MKKSIEEKLAYMKERFEEISRLLSDAQTIANHDQFKNLSKEYSELEPIAQTWTEYCETSQNITDLTQLIEGDDQDLSLMAEEEIKTLREQQEQTEKTLQYLLLPKDPEDNRNVYLEIRAGAGGDEAAIFAGDLFRMYSRYAESQGWHVEIVSENVSEQGGFKEVIAKISGRDVYARLKFESGAHRVQRVPTTESQGRIHTSTCTVAIMPEVDEIDEIKVNTDEIRVDTYRASGAGGQHVNKTDSAIRLTHIPTGIVVECQDERSQHKNRAKAMALLQTKLLDAQRSKQQAEQAQTRKSLVGTGDRSERIRTYNFPQGRLTDHRINLTLYQLDDIIEGHLNPILDALSQEHQAELLAELGRS